MYWRMHWEKAITKYKEDYNYKRKQLYIIYGFQFLQITPRKLTKFESSDYA